MIRFDYCKYWLVKARENIQRKNYHGAIAFITSVTHEIDGGIQSQASGTQPYR